MIGVKLPLQENNKANISIVSCSSKWSWSKPSTSYDGKGFKNSKILSPFSSYIPHALWSFSEIQSWIVRKETRCHSPLSSSDWKVFSKTRPVLISWRVRFTLSGVLLDPLVLVTDNSRSQDFTDIQIGYRLIKLISNNNKCIRHTYYV